MKKGFTLVELLIVLAVIAALMAVATPMALNAVKQAKASQVAQNLENIKTAEENYVNTEQSLPATTVDQLVSKNYLSSKPDGYTIDTAPSPTAWSNGQVKVTIKYNGGDVTADDVHKQNPNVKGGSGAPTLEATVVKWW